MIFISINDIAAALSDAMDFDGSLTTTTATMSFDSTTRAATTTATTTAATTTAATTVSFTTYTPSSDIATIANNHSPVTLSSQTQSHLSR